MSSLEELLSKQTETINDISKTLANVRQLGQAKMTPDTLSRIKTLKILFSRCRDLDAEIVAIAGEEANVYCRLYIANNLFKEMRNYVEAIDFMLRILEKNSHSTSTGSSTTRNYDNQQSDGYTTKSIIRNGSKQDVPDKLHKTTDSTERLSVNAIEEQSCQTSTQANSSNTLQAQGSASDHSSKRKQPNRDITNINPNQTFRFNGGYISRAEFLLDCARFRFRKVGQKILKLQVIVNNFLRKKLLRPGKPT